MLFIAPSSRIDLPPALYVLSIGRPALRLFSLCISRHIGIHYRPLFLANIIALPVGARHGIHREPFMPRLGGMSKFVPPIDVASNFDIIILTNQGNEDALHTSR